MTSLPKLSIIVVVDSASRQALNTLHSLSCNYQREVASDDYEVIVIENTASNRFDEQQVRNFGANFRYHLHKETSPTLAGTINFGMAKTLAAHVCLITDASCLATPRIIRYSLDLLRLTSNVLIAIPSYQLTLPDQKSHESILDTTRIDLLKNIDWPQQAYRLFDIATFGSANAHGFFHPLMESQCLVFSKCAFEKIGGAHTDFTLPNGYISLDLYRALALLPESQLFILYGEGSFQQPCDDQRKSRAELSSLPKEEFKKIRGQYYKAALREPTLYGTAPAPALKFLQASSVNAQRRFFRFAELQENPWHDDTAS